MKIIVNTIEKTLAIGALSIRCAIGKRGTIAREEGREGDGKTPLGTYGLRFGLFREDRCALPTCRLPLYPISEDDGWCDEPNDPAYNRPVRLPYQASAERLFRESNVYDIIIVLGHNDSPPEPDLGSAIFMHIARQGYIPTEGCIAIAHKDMLSLLPLIGPESTIMIR